MDPTWEFLENSRGGGNTLVSVSTDEMESGDGALFFDVVVRFVTAFFLLI